MREIGVNAYRLSISWPRVFPAGTGTVNVKGLGFYDRLIDELLAKEIEPWIALFHWDYPYELFLRGGWLNSESPKWFADYVEVVVDRLSDRVDHWITLNEPQCFLHLGHSVGDHAPGLKLGLHEVLLATHHTLLAHGLGVQAMRGRAKKKPLVGWAAIFPVIAHPAPSRALARGGARAFRHRPAGRNDSRSLARRPLPRLRHRTGRGVLRHLKRPASAQVHLSHPLFSGPQASGQPVFDFRAHFCHSAPMETHAFGFRLRANAPEGQKRFPISKRTDPELEAGKGEVQLKTGFGRRYLKSRLDKQ